MDKAQEKIAGTTGKPKGPFPAVPTTKVLAIGQFTTPPTPEQTLSTENIYSFFLWVLCVSSPTTD